jgi:hypothetical protein
VAGAVTKGGVAALFDDVARRLISEDPALEYGRMFNSDGLKTNGKFFAFPGSNGDLIVKLPAERVAELVAGGEGRPLTMGKRTMREWVRVMPSDTAACAGYVAEAQAFVGGTVSEAAAPRRRRASSQSGPPTPPSRATAPTPPTS